MVISRSSKLLFLLACILLVAFIFWFSLPSKLFDRPSCTILEDEKGELLGAKIADDGQWRFPSPKEVPEKFKQCITLFEDKNFLVHYGIDILALGSAIQTNIRSGKIVRGASTISMQVIRLYRKNKRRTYFEKIIEIILALRLELTNSKQEILALYISEAPFGGNVVGLEAASWRYFGQSPQKLSWSETTMLAVLPNSPSLIFPGKNQLKLKKKRDRLLLKLKKSGVIDETTYRLALKEPIPGKPYPLPSLAPHLLGRLEKDGLKGQRNISTIKIGLHKKVTEILLIHQQRLISNGIYNAAAIVLEVETGKVLAYVGNTSNKDGNEHGYKVDLIQGKRSTGSILKPLLFAMMLDEGRYLNSSLVADIPTIIAGYAPKNYFLNYDGAVSFKNSISRSLNVPSVRLLHEYGIEKFHYNLKKLGLTTLTKPANHYGLSLILGGAEATLWDLSGIYRNMAHSLNRYHINHTAFTSLPQIEPSYLKNNPTPKKIADHPIFSASSIWLTFEAMNEVSRPEEELAWKNFSSSYKIAWKTGTSFGNRDGWSIGSTPHYVVAVWTGNADGEGRPELTGISAAAPIMFDIFKLLKSDIWFMQPFNDMKETYVCSKSGYKASETCEIKELQWIQKTAVNSSLCPYHKIIYLDKQNNFRVNSNCESLELMQRKEWFVLPPAMEYYYKTKNSNYKILPPFRPDCMDMNNMKSFEIIYPQNGSKIFVPIELDGKSGKTVFEVANRNASAEVFWYLDNYFIGTTKNFHRMGLNPTVGNHKLTVTDEIGESKEIYFEVINSK